MSKINKLGYKIAVSGVVVVLLWIGFFKFTPSEAVGIKPYVENHFLMSWMYKVLSVQVVSNIIGLFEIIVGIGLIWSLFKPQVGKIFGWAAVVIFGTTLSFLLTTPGINKIIDGVPTTDFFVLKDIMALGISLMVVYNETGLDWFDCSTDQDAKTG